jgi:putative ABC transport system permease protein
MLHDLRQAFRSIRKRPGFAAVAVLTLAFGIGVNTSIFSLVSGLFLQPLPVQNPHELVMVMQRGEVINVPYGHSFPDYLDYRESASSLSDLVAFFPTPVHLGVRGQAPERTWVEVVSPNYFALAGAMPAAGRLLSPGEGEQKGAAPAIVLSYAYWQRRFAGDPSIIGQPVALNGTPFTVAGVAAESFTGLSWAMAVSAWVPAGTMGAVIERGDQMLESRGAPMFRLMGRLAPGRTVADARAELEVVTSRLVAEYPVEHKGMRVLVIPENRARPDPSVAEFLPVFAVLFAGLVALVLFIACANVANLMIARALEQQRDLVIRSALGASRWQLVRMQVTEGLVLAALAGALGLVMAQWAGQALQGFTPTGDLPVNQQQPWDWRIYPFTLLVSAIAGIATAVWPARQASRFNLVESLKEGARDAGRTRHRLRNALVIGQVGLSLVVLASAGLFLHSLRQMQNVALGVRTDGLLLASIDLGLQQYSPERGRQFLDAALERAEQLPGVTSATVAAHVPLDYGMLFNDVTVEGQIPGTSDGYLAIAFNVVGPRFLETTGARILQGRGLEPADDASARRVALVNQTMAARLWPARDAIGQRFRAGRDGDWVEVVGVVADGKYLMLWEEPRPYFFVPLTQVYRAPMTLMVRAGGDPAGLVAPLTHTLRTLDPDLPIYNVRAMDAHVRDSIFGLLALRMGAALAAGQGLIALLLAVLGLYAVVSYAVAVRTREIGLRMALGADHGDVLRLVVREGMRLTLAGVALGLVGALALGFVLSHLLYGVGGVDAGVYVGVTALLLGVAAIACYLPARRATRVDPMLALRAE